MWQKKLNQIKKQTVIAQSTATPKTRPAPVVAAEISFSQYCRDLAIEPLKQDQVVTIQPKPPRIPLTNHQLGMNHGWEGGFEFIDEETALQEFFRHGQRQLPAELRNAKYPITLRIDLHQHTKTSALRRLEQLLENSSPAAVLLIIHGQGLGSSGNQPVLRGAIRKYLEHHSSVLAYSYGSQRQGADGVTLVKLRS